MFSVILPICLALRTYYTVRMSEALSYWYATLYDILANCIDNNNNDDDKHSPGKTYASQYKLCTSSSHQ